MTAPAIVSLKKAGESVTLSVMSCAPASVGQYPEIEFTGIDSSKSLVKVAVPKASADRQFGRLGLTMQEIVGKTITISRDPNQTAPSKPYWGITLSDVQQPVPASTPAQAAVPTNGNGNGESGAALYAKTTDWALRTIIPKYAEAGIPITMEGTAAIVATLYIQANKQQH